MGWFSDLRDGVVGVVTAPIVAPVKAAAAIVTGKSPIKAVSNYAATVTAAPYNYYAAGIDAASPVTGVKASSLPIYGTAQNYFKTGDSKSYWDSQAKILASMGAAAGGSAALGNELGIDISSFQNEFEKYQSNLSNLKNLLPKGTVVAGQTTPSVATFPEAQAAINAQKNSMIFALFAIAAVGYLMVKK